MHSCAYTHAHFPLSPIAKQLPHHLCKNCKEVASWALKKLEVSVLLVEGSIGRHCRFRWHILYESPLLQDGGSNHEIFCSARFEACPLEPKLNGLRVLCSKYSRKSRSTGNSITYLFLRIAFLSHLFFKELKVISMVLPSPPFNTQNDLAN